MQYRPNPAEWRPDADLVRRVDAATDRWQQGDIVLRALASHVGAADAPLTPETAEIVGAGVKLVEVAFEESAVITPTCDIVRSADRRPFVQIAPVLRLAGQELANARAGRIPRYAPVPGLGENAFADLDRCTTAEKTLLAGLRQVRGCPDDASLLAFSRAVDRHRARFAFPDAWENAARALKTSITKRAGKNSPEGRCVDALTQIRAVALPSWDHPYGYAVTLEFVVHHASLDAVDDEEEEADDDIVQWLQPLRSAEELAGMIDTMAATTDQATRSVLWMALAQAWADLVETGGNLTAVTGVAESEKTYSVFRQDHSAELNFDHLSPEGSSQQG